jgi:hypothetical protein
MQRFDAWISTDTTGRAVIAVPFDPDEVWGAKPYHLVGGTIDQSGGGTGGRKLRGRITLDEDQWVFTITPMWMQDAGVDVGDEVSLALEPEGPQRTDLADDVAAALKANPAAEAFFDTLAQFYRKAYLRYIDATTRRPEVRSARIAEVVGLLEAGVKQRPRS